MPSVLDSLGGEAGVTRLVETFYDLIESDPRGTTLRKLHARGQGIAHARIEQANFLIGFFGGRQHYREKHGHMDVRLMHAHVPITDEDAENWLALMETALRRCARDPALSARLLSAFRRVALTLVNGGDATLGAGGGAGQPSMST
ncbi:group II truncated hemoglobin [Brevirhabdus sp.]|uniref:group II truncated hemoglobin n=1 Tax=Brevirhabdus sp. TaxID=2004514 RepID=UPI00405A34A1